MMRKLPSVCSPAQCPIRQQSPRIARGAIMPADDAKGAERMQPCAWLDKAAVAEHLVRRMARSDIMSADDAKAAERLQSCALLTSSAIAGQ